MKKAQEIIAAERVEKLWQQKENKIAQNLKKIFGDKNRLISNTPVDVDVGRVGGGSKSDIRITNKTTKKSFFIESKLNYSSSEYFKFHLLLQGKNLLHSADNKL